VSVRSTFGIDGFDLFVHCAVTICAIIVTGPVMQMDPSVALGGIPVTSLLVLSWRRKRGLADLPPDEAADEPSAQRMYELEERVAELETMQFRMQELEERVDFAERLLTQSPQVQDPRLLG
jgi:uncharacterized coiled-coil protein SlyX